MVNIGNTNVGKNRGVAEGPAESSQQPFTSAVEVERTGTDLIAAPVRGPFSIVPEKKHAYKGRFHEPTKPADESTLVVRLEANDQKFGRNER